MNLIEQLGGYEAAKKKYQDLSDSDMITIGPIEFSAKDYFEDELLEYRRQHNIFEENDKIVFIDDFMHDELMVVAWTRKGEVWMDGGAKRCTNLSMIRHATPEEIKAGKRLEAL